MVYAVCFKQGERTLPVYYEYGGNCFSDDLARAFARAEEAGEMCLLSELPESYLSEVGITYPKPAAWIEMNDGRASRDPWDGTGLSPCECSACANCALSNGKLAYCTLELGAVRHACGGFESEKFPHYKICYRGNALFSFRAEGALGISPIRIEKLFSGISRELTLALARPDFRVADLEITDGATGAPAPFVIHGKGYFFPYGRALIDLGFYPDHPELSALDADTFRDASGVYAVYRRIPVTSEENGVGEIVTDPKVLSEMERGGYLVRA